MGRSSHVVGRLPAAGRSVRPADFGFSSWPPPENTNSPSPTTVITPAAATAAIFIVGRGAAGAGAGSRTTGTLWVLRRSSDSDLNAPIRRRFSTPAITRRSRASSSSATMSDARRWASSASSTWRIAPSSRLSRAWRQNWLRRSSLDRTALVSARRSAALRPSSA